MADPGASSAHHLRGKKGWFFRSLSLTGGLLGDFVALEINSNASYSDLCYDGSAYVTDLRVLFLRGGTNFSPSIQQRQADLCRFKVSLVYIESSRTAIAT